MEDTFKYAAGRYEIKSRDKKKKKGVDPHTAFINEDQLSSACGKKPKEGAHAKGKGKKTIGKSGVQYGLKRRIRRDRGKGSALC